MAANVLYTYFRMLIHIGITIELAIKDYWEDLNTWQPHIPEYQI